MKVINEKFEDKEHKHLTKQKKQMKLTWRQYILKLSKYKK